MNHPAIMKNCVMDWYSTWSTSVYRNVAESAVSKCKAIPPDFIQRLVDVSVGIHRSVESSATALPPWVETDSTSGHRVARIHTVG